MINIILENIAKKNDQAVLEIWEAAAGHKIKVVDTKVEGLKNMSKKSKSRAREQREKEKVS